MLTLREASVVGLLLVPAVQAPSPVKYVDHVMFTGGLELTGLVAILRDRFGLPVVYDGAAETPPSPFTMVSLGNVCLEVVALPREPADARRQGTLGNLALQAVDFAGAVDALRSRSIDHLSPQPQARWSTIGLRGMDLGFFIEYHAGMEARRARFRRELDARQGGVLGIVRAIEIAKTTSRIAEVRPAWNRLLGAPAGEVDLWRVGDDLAIRLVAANDPRANRVVVAVKGLESAAAVLQRLAIRHLRTDDEVSVDPAALFGLRLVLKPSDR